MAIDVIAQKVGVEVADEFRRLILRVQSVEDRLNVAKITGKVSKGTVLPDPEQHKQEFFELLITSAVSTLHYSRRTAGGGYAWATVTLT